MHMLNDVVRSELHDMIDYYIGVLHGFELSTGKNGKYFRKYLPPDIYERYAATYSGNNYEEIWASIDTMCDPFIRWRLLWRSISASLTGRRKKTG